MSYRAFVVNKDGDNFTAGTTTLSESDLPQGDVTIRVEWSSVNYKDGLACTPNGRVVRGYPMVPGVDLAGVVTESTDSRFAPGQGVIAHGHDIGVSHPGGFAELARMPAEFCTALPDGLTTKEAMAIGTAGFTAAQSVLALEQYGVTPAKGPVIVTGATGGVGSTAVSMLAMRGFTVAGSTGKADEHDYLRNLGATEILSREEVSAESNRPLESERWAGAVDPVGGATTAYLLRTTKYGGAVALSGLTGGTTVSTTVMPFILRGVGLLGIDSVQYPIELRRALWQRLATDLKPKGLLESIAVETDLDGIPAAVEKILRGGIRGRMLVRLT
ncbi:MAG: oxidoreductase [Dehalococcoidia bacterium]|nr:oxidoreductase [Dehalococcoidia bacterium]